MALHPLPVVLQASQVSFESPATIGMSRAPSLGLRNDQAVGVLIHTLAYNVRTAGVLATTHQPRIELRWRDQSLTNGYVPVYAMTYPRNRAYEVAGRNTIRLEKPLYLAPGEYLQISLRPYAAIAANDMSVSITATGVQAEEPAERWLPYFTHFETATYTDGAGTTISDVSAPPQLGNPFDVPLFVDRLIGRVVQNSTNRDQGLNVVWTTFNLRISDHLDRFWIANPAPLPVVFSVADRSWIIRHEMEPKGYLRVEFEGTANVTRNGGVNSRAVVGLVGYRRIA